MAYSKIIYGGNVLIDLTGDTVAADKLLAGITAHGKDGEEITGTCAYDAATGDATAVEGEILLGKTAYVKGAKKTGTMPNRGAVTGTTAHDKAGNAITGALTFATVYTGSGAPDASLGADGDIYLDLG